MNMISVRSSAIRAIGYDALRRLLKIKFSQGETYDFCNVPESTYQGLINSRSKGSYYNNHIKDRFHC